LLGAGWVVANIVHGSGESAARRGGPETTKGDSSAPSPDMTEGGRDRRKCERTVFDVDDVANLFR
jgi:hypothetical protein